MLAAALVYQVTTARLAFTTLAALGWFFLAPRWDCSWQIEHLRFQTLRLRFQTLTLEMDVDVRVWNPNHVPGAQLLNASLSLFRVQPPPHHHQPQPQPSPLFPAAAAAAAATTASSTSPPNPKRPGPTPVPLATSALLPPVRGPAFGTAVLLRAHAMPRRDAFPLHSRVSLLDLPLATALGLLWDVLSGLGSVRVRAAGPARVRAAQQEVVVWIDCLQQVQVLPLPTPQITVSACSYALEGGVGVGAMLEEALASMDFALARPVAPSPAVAAAAAAVGG